MAGWDDEKARPNFNIEKSWRDAIKVYQAKKRSTLSEYYIRAIKNQMIKDGIFVQDDKNDWYLFFILTNEHTLIIISNINFNWR